MNRKENKMTENKRLEQPLSAAEIEELKRLHVAALENRGVFTERKASFYDYLCETMFNALPRLLSMLQPPSEASVREAVEHCSERAFFLTNEVRVNNEKLRILLSHVRPGQSPRLTDAQAAALHIAYLRCKEEGSLTDVVEILESTFPGVFGKEG